MLATKKWIIYLSLLTASSSFSGCSSEMAVKKEPQPGSGQTKSATTAQTKQTNSCESPFNSRIMTAKDFLQSYNNNPIVFDATFKGKCVALWGLVSGMTSTTGYSVTLQPVTIDKVERESSESNWQWFYRKGDSMPAINFYLPKDEVSELSEITLGKSTAIFIGKVIGIIDGVSIGIKDSRMYDAPMPYRASRCISILKEKAEDMAQNYISGDTYGVRTNYQLARYKNGYRSYMDLMNLCADIPDIIPRSFDAP